MRRWTPAKIYAWGQRQFNLPGVSIIASRMNREVSELVDEGTRLLEAQVHGSNHHDIGRCVAALRAEAVDVQIMLDQIFEALQVSPDERDELIDKKMDINQLRKWGVSETGRHQHVEEGT